MPQNANRFYAQDLYLCAWLVANDEPVLDVEYYLPTRKAIFWFENRANLQRLVKLYRDGAAYIQLRTVFDAHRKVIRMVAEARHAASEGEVA